MRPINLSIAGEPGRKSNSRRITYRKRRDGSTHPIIVKSQKALDWVNDALRQITGDKRQQVGSKEKPLSISFWIRYGNDMCDLSHELILDMLQDAEVITNDRWVYETHSYKYIDKDNPGVDIVIEEIQPSHDGTLQDIVREVAPGLLELPPAQMIETVRAVLASHITQTRQVLDDHLSEQQVSLIENERTHHELIEIDLRSSGSARLTWSDGEVFTVDRTGETSDYAYVNERGERRN